jgi:DNA repair exonuclease SbcCD ATPase subunit
VHNDRLRNLFGARQIVSDRIKRLIDFRIGEQVPFARIEHYFGKVDQLAGEHEESVEDLRGRIGELSHRFEEMARLQRWSANELERIIPQLGSQESQLESLREKISAVPAADGPQAAEARSLIDEIRREHSQIRVRMTAVAQYEDRLRKLEDRTQ